MSYNYEQGDMVDFEYKTIKGYGKICGCATTGSPILGRHYIVEIFESEGIDYNVYPFECVSISESQFKLRR